MPPTTVPPTTILDLPSELVATIFHDLPDLSVFAARRASKDLERASFSFFAKRFFRKKGYMLTTPSLEVFKSVAAHEGLRQYVQHVWFNMDCYTFAGSEFEPGPDEELSEEDGKRRAAYLGIVADYERLVYTDRLEQTLSTALATLPNLKAVGMRRSEDHSPWGWSRLQTLTGRDPRILGEIPSAPSPTLSAATLLFIALIHALATTKGHHELQRLYTDAVEIDNIAPTSLSPDTLAAACNSILYLELNATLAELPASAAQNLHTRLSNPYLYGAGLQALLQHTPHLRELGLQIFPDRKQSHLVPPSPREPESWRGSYPYLALQRASSNIHLPHLRRLKLEKLITTPSTLIALLAPGAAYLASLKLRDIRLLPDPLAQSTPETCQNAKPWIPLFTFLATSCPSLTSILLSHLSHPTGSIRFVPTLPAIPPVDPSVPRLSTVANAGDFADYENITVSTQSLEETQGRLRGLAGAHWYGRNCFSYAMDEGVWHTDTSDEEW